MSVHGFGSPEAMFRAIEESRKVADKFIKDWQRTIQPGAKVIRVGDAGEYGILVIYGEILDPVALERKHYDLEDPAEAAEFARVKSQYGEDWQRSFRHGRFYSETHPDGELGDTHLTTLVAEITDEEFESARGSGWKADLNLVRTAVGRQHG